MGARVEDKRIALQEEAKTLMPGVLQSQQDGSKSTQQYVDAVCGTMRDSQSPGHHIVVENAGEVVQASAHHRASPEMLSAILRAADQQSHRGTSGSGELVVGVYSQGDTIVYVSETATLPALSRLTNVTWLDESETINGTAVAVEI